MSAEFYWNWYQRMNWSSGCSNCHNFDLCFLWQLLRRQPAGTTHDRYPPAKRSINYYWTPFFRLTACKGCASSFPGLGIHLLTIDTRPGNENWDQAKARVWRRGELRNVFQELTTPRQSSLFLAIVLIVDETSGGYNFWRLNIRRLACVPIHLSLGSIVWWQTGFLFLFPLLFCHSTSDRQ